MQSFMKENFKHFISDRFIKVSVWSSVLLLVAQIMLIGITFLRLPPYIPFFNSMPWGEDRLSPSQIILFFPVILITIFLMNIFIGTALYKKYAFIARILVFNVLLFTLLGFFAYLQIIFLVF